MPNPTGRNQYGEKRGIDYAPLREALQEYHREGISDNCRIRQRLKEELGLDYGTTKIKQLRSSLGLIRTSSKCIRQTLTEDEMRDVVIQKLQDDPANGLGLVALSAKIRMETGLHIPRDFVSKVMHEERPEGFDSRAPGARLIKRSKKFPLGPDERWASDGHEKLKSICGVGVYTIVDDATGRILAMSVLPNTRNQEMVALVFLDCVIERQGIPIQLSTDCGTETGLVHGLITELRHVFHKDFAVVGGVDAHVAMRSVHNVSAERGWVTLVKQFNRNAEEFHGRGIEDGTCNLDIPIQKMLRDWIWFHVVRNELQPYVKRINGTRIRKQDKAGPSGMSRNQAYWSPESWNGQHCLLSVDIEYVERMKEKIVDNRDIPTTVEFNDWARRTFHNLGLDFGALCFPTAWVVFRQMLPLFPI